jgi:hypothetical protein
MSNRLEIFLDTDVYLDHLFYDKRKKNDEESFLLKSVRLFDCYTSVINASEIFAGCSSESMKQKAKHSFYGSGVLGIPFKYSVKAGEVIRAIKKKILNAASGIQ